MINKMDNLRGAAYLRVGIALGRRGADVVSIWQVDQPAIQQAQVQGDILVRVDLGGKPAFLEGSNDPRVIRGIFREGFGHSHQTKKIGILYVTVPFTAPRDLEQVRIRLADIAKVSSPGRRAEEVSAWMDNPPAHFQPLGDIAAGALQSHQDWPAVARKLGLAANAGSFEIYKDREGKFRWRLRRTDGEIVADSAQGYAEREACEADLRWLRAQAGTASVISLDIN